MGVKIYIATEEVWNFFKKNTDRLEKEMVTIAENPDTKYAVYLTEKSGYPLICVCRGELPPEYEEGAITMSDCTDTVKRCYSKFLFPISVTDKGSFQEKECLGYESCDTITPDLEDAMYEREDDLVSSMSEFLKIAISGKQSDTDIIDEYGLDFVNDILENVLEYISYEHCIPIYRPMIFTDDETESEIYTEYPYETIDE